MEQVTWRRSRSAFVIDGCPAVVLSSAMLVILAAMRCSGRGGNWGLLALVLGVFLVGGLGTGLLVSTLVDSQQMALQVSLLIAFLPTFMLSGFIFPIPSMPEVLQYVTVVVPARYFLIALRGIVLKGLDPQALWHPILAMVVYALTVLGLSR